MTAPPSDGTGRGLDEPTSWMTAIAICTALTPVPSSIWRLSILLAGQEHLEARLAAETVASLSVKLILISLLSCAASSTSLLLVGWRRLEVPRWIPIVGACRLHAASLHGAAIALSVPLLFLSFHICSQAAAVFQGKGHPQILALIGNDVALVTLCYLPMCLWGPLLILLAFDHRARSLRSN